METMTKEQYKEKREKRKLGLQNQRTDSAGESGVRKS